MLDSLYKMVTPWSIASKQQIMVNRLLGVMANTLYPAYCRLSHFNKKSIENKPKVVVSLTTYPARVGKVHLCIESILRQKCQADMVILWLASSQFPYENSIPAELIYLKDKGLTIRYCEDIRSYKKVFYTAQEYPSEIIITADDDTLYPENWLEGLMNEYERNPDCVICYRAHKFSFDGDVIAPYDSWNFQSPGIKGPDDMLIPIGVGGVLYPPGYFTNVDFNIEVIRNLCPTTDDLWLKAMGFLNGYKAVKVNPYSKEWFTIKNSQKSSLMQTNIGLNQNDLAIRKLSEYYGIKWRKET